MSETRIQLNQISGLNQNETLSTHLSSLNDKIGIFGGQVDNVTALGSLTPVLDQHIFVKADNKWVRYNGSTWVDITTTAGGGGGGGATDLDDLTDVTITSPSNGQVLLYNGTAWVNGASAGGGGGATNLDGLTDVVITSASSGQVIKYNGTSWVNTGIAISDITGLQAELDGKADDVHTHAISDVTGLQTELDAKAESLEDLSDINISSVLDGQILTYDSATSKWVAETPSASASSLNELTDVVVSTPTSGQVVVYDGSNWVNDAIDISSVDNLQNTLDGKASSTHSHAISDVTDLQTELDGKASSSHTHSIENISDLQDSLNAKVETAVVQVLQNNVNTLTSQLTTFFDTFNDSFVDSNYIDMTIGTGSTNLIRVTSGSETYIRANRQYNVEVNTNLELDVDTVNTSNISYSSGALQLTSGQTDGTFTSKFYDVTATTQAIVGADFTQVSADTFGAEQGITPPSGTLQTNMINFTTIVDSTGIRWYFYQTVLGCGRIYGWAVNTDGTSFMSHREISSGLTSGTLSVGIYKTLSIKVDKNDNIWIAAYRHVGTTSGSGIRISTIKINKSTPTTQTVIEDFAVGVNPVHSIDTFYDFINDRFHLVAGTNGLGIQLRIFECNTNSLISGASRQILATSASYNIKLAHNPNTLEIAVFAMLNGVSNGMRATRYSVNTSTYGNQNQALVLIAPASIGLGSSGVMEVFYHSTHGYVIANVRNGGTVLELVKLSASFTGTSNYVVETANTLTGGIVVSASDSSAFADATHIHMVYADNNTTNKSLYYTKIRMSDGSITESNNSVFNRAITVTNNLNDSYPVLERYSNTTTLYFTQEGSTGVFNPERVVFGNNSSKIKVEAQSINNDWVTVYDNFVSPTFDQRGSLLTLGVSKTQIRVRVTLQSPNASTMTPTLNAYQAYVPDNSLGQTISNFISKSTFNDRTVSKVTLTASQQLNGGTIEWYLSNNGGSTWSPQVTLGSEYAFPVVGGDLRVKATLTIPAGTINADSPRIDDYTIVTSNSVVQSDIIPIQINLSRTNFRFAALQNATRYSMKNMVVDTFTDTTGINASSSSNYTFDNTNKLVKATNTSTECIVTVPTESLSVAPSSIFISSETTLGTGSISFEASRDGGTTWKSITNEVLTNINDIATGTNLAVRAKINGNATLNAWAYSWS